MICLFTDKKTGRRSKEKLRSGTFLQQC